MIRLHHLNNSRTQRILWLLEEIGVDYEIVDVARDPKTLRAPASLRTLHPLGKAPILETDEGMTLAESGLIVEYLIARYGNDLAPDPADKSFWRYRYWMHYAEGSLMGQLTLKLVTDRLGLLAVPIRRMVREQLDLHLDFLEIEAGRHQWFAGDSLSGADIMMSYPLEAAVSRAGLGPSRPALWRRLQQIRSRPAYARAIERGGAFSPF
jgi:glutathione S-transferase